MAKVVVITGCSKGGIGQLGPQDLVLTLPLPRLGC